MSKLIDLTGQRFGRLTVVGRAENTRRGNARWNCRCDCGEHTCVVSGNLQNGNAVSCGCLNREHLASGLRFSHGKSKDRIYQTYRNMIRRCCEPTNREFKNYGGRGISVCEEWMDGFEKFYSWAEKSGYADKLTIDRIDANKNYEPSNCRWATYKEQGNNLRKNVYYTIAGETKTLAEWADVFGVEYKKLWHQTRERGLRIVDALALLGAETKC